MQVKPLGLLAAAVTLALTTACAATASHDDLRPPVHKPSGCCTLSPTVMPTSPLPTVPEPEPTSPTPTVSYTWPPAACGVERWHVKTGTDPQAAAISLTDVRLTTIAALTSIPAPPVLPADSRLGPTELTVWRVIATLTGYKLEADSDYHLILSDGGRTMIAEIPDPACVGKSSPFLPGIELARTQFDAQFRTLPVMTRTSRQVTVTGVGFFDYQHGQTGVAPNAVELHPVLSIEFGP